MSKMHWVSELLDRGIVITRDSFYVPDTLERREEQSKQREELIKILEKAKPSYKELETKLQIATETILYFEDQLNSNYCPCCDDGVLDLSCVCELDDLGQLKTDLHTKAREALEKIGGIDG